MKKIGKIGKKSLYKMLQDLRNEFEQFTWNAPPTDNPNQKECQIKEVPTNKKNEPQLEKLQKDVEYYKKQAIELAEKLGYKDTEIWELKKLKERTPKNKTNTFLDIWETLELGSSDAFLTIQNSLELFSELCLTVKEGDTINQNAFKGVYYLTQIILKILPNELSFNEIESKKIA